MKRYNLQHINVVSAPTFTTTTSTTTAPITPGQYITIPSETWNTATSTAGWNPVQQYVYPPTVAFEEVKHEVFKTPLKDLANMWLAKFGNAWVSVEAVYSENFYRLACYRLARAGKIENAFDAHIGMDQLRLMPEE